MKQLLVVAFFTMFGLNSCCNKCDPDNPVCLETPPTNEMCQAAFSRWFFDSNTNSCSQVGYSGCSMKGFATKEECEECKCRPGTAL